MNDYPETTLVPDFSYYCYNDEVVDDQGFYYGGPGNSLEYKSGFEGSRRADTLYRTDVAYSESRTENPFNPRPSNREMDRNYWGENRDGRIHYHDDYANGYFQATQLDRQREEPFNIPSRRQDTLFDGGFENGFASQYSSQPEYKPQPIMANGYSYNNPYAEAAMASQDTFGTEIPAFGKSLTDNWRNQYVEERPIRPQGNPWRNTYEYPYDNRSDAFAKSLQPSIPNSGNNDPFADWAGYAEKNWPTK